jgi:hypothetical protein
MSRIMFPVVAATAIIVSTASAFALESNVTVKSSMSPDAVWKKIGDFCGIKSWIPAVTGCVISADGKQRTVSLKNETSDTLGKSIAVGSPGILVERLDNWDDAKRSYSYSILSGPLAVSDYHSTLIVLPDGKGSALNWHSTYQAKGTSDAEAQKLIDNIYEDSAKSLFGD